MIFYIKEWGNKTATLMTEDGIALWHFVSADEARRVLRNWYNVQDGDIRYHVGFLRESGVSECEVA
jgi:hypothetical protein